jgi:hypothetical protein
MDYIGSLVLARWFCGRAAFVGADMAHLILRATTAFHKLLAGCKCAFIL